MIRNIYIKKAICLLIILSLSVPAITNYTSAKEVTNSLLELKTNYQFNIQKKDNSKSKKSQVVKKTKNSTTFEKENGGKELVIYGSDVRFTDEKGDLKDYDPSLVTITKEEKQLTKDLQDYQYRNKEGDKQQYFPEKLTVDTPIMMESDKHVISFRPIFANEEYKAIAIEDEDDAASKKKQEVNSKDTKMKGIVDVLEKVNKASMQKEADYNNISTEKEKIVNLYDEKKEIVNKAVYSLADESMQLEYISEKNGVKENIVLYKKPDSNIFLYELKIKDIDPVMNETDGSIILYKKDTKNIVAYIMPPNMNDATGKAYSKDLSYSIGLKEGEADTYILALTVSQEYLDNEERVYPVTVDPEVIWNGRSMADVPVFSYRDYENWFGTSILSVGVTDRGIWRTYFKFYDLTNILYGKLVDSAFLILTPNRDLSEINPYNNSMQAHRVTQAWDETNITFANQPTSSVEYLDSIEPNNGIYGPPSLDLTQYARDIASGRSTDYGIMLRNESESAHDYGFETFYSSQGPNEPVLIIFYDDVPTLQEENYLQESPHYYTNNYSNTWTIKKNGVKNLRVHFSKIETENFYDYVTTSAGDCVSGNYPDGYWSNVVPGDTMTVSLKTNDSMVKWGFAIDKISYTFGDELIESYIQESPHDYTDNYSNTWTIKKNGAKNLRVHFSEIETEKYFDFVTTSAGDKVSGSYPDGYWSDVVPGDTMTVSLKTDGSVVKWGFAIDKISYTFGDALIEPYTQESPHDYTNNYSNTWTFKKNGVKNLRVHFSKIDTEERCDFVTTSAGDKISGSYPGGYWSSFASGNSIDVTLTSDASILGWGYAIDRISYDDDDVPSTPYNVLVTRRTTSSSSSPASITLTWNKSNDSSNNITYDIYNKASDGTTSKIGSTKSTYYTITGNNNNTLKYYVVARDPYGNISDDSKLVSATTEGLSASPVFEVYTVNDEEEYVPLEDGASVPINTDLYVSFHHASASYMILKYARGIVRRVMDPEFEEEGYGFYDQLVNINMIGTQDISLEYGDNCDKKTITFKVTATSSIQNSITPPMQVSDEERLHFGEEGVNVGTGNFCYSEEDIDWEIPAFQEGTLNRYYNSKDNSNDSSMGTGWRNSFSGKITISNGNATVTMPDGSIKPYTVSGGNYTSNWTHDKLTYTGGTVTLGGKTIYYKLTLTDQTIFGYDSAGSLIAISDQYGNVTTFDLDANGRVVKVIGPTGRYLTLTYSESTRLLSNVTDDKGRIQSYYYNEKNQLVESVSPSGRPIYYFYDGNGKLSSYKKVSEIYGDEPKLYEVEAITYSNGKVSTLTNEYGNTNTYTYGYNNIPNRTRVTRTDGTVNEYDYDDIYHRYYVTRYMDGLDAVSTTTYNSYGDILENTDRLGNKYIYTIDTNGNVTTTTNPDGGKRYYTYNSKNNITCESDTDLFTNPTSFKNTTWYLYDASGIYLEKKAVQRAESVAKYSPNEDQDKYIITSSTYKVSGTFKGSILTNSLRVDSNITNTTGYTYNDEGSLLTKTDPADFVTSYEVNNEGRVVKITQPTGERTVKQYDFDGNLLRESNFEADGDSVGTTRAYADLSNRTMFIISGENYNPANDGLNYIDDNTSTTANSIDIYYGSANATLITYIREKDDCLDKTTAGNGEVTQTIYDKLGQVKEFRDSTGSVTSFTYDKLGRNIETYKKTPNDVAAKLTSTTKYLIVDNYNEKEINAQQITSTSYLDGTTISSETTNYKDFAGRTVKVQTEDNSSGTTKMNVVEYDFSPSGLMMGSKETTDNGITLNKEVTYNGAGQIASVKVPFDTINGTPYYSTTTYAYNGDGSLRETGVMCNAPGSVEAKRITAYEYDKRGNVVVVKLTDGKVGTKENYTQYYYDKAGRLRRVYQGLSARLNITGLDTVTAGTDTQYSVIEYEYDGAGNLASKTDADGFVTTYFSYDKNGNLKKLIDPNGSITSYQYDNMGRITYKEIIATDAAKSCKESHEYFDPVNGNTEVKEIITVTNGTQDPVTTTRIMDTSGRLTSEVIHDVNETGLQGIQKLYSYNLDGSRKSFEVKINDVSKLNLSYDYTTQGQLNTLYENGTHVASYTYDGEGKLASKSYGHIPISQAYTYNQLGAVKTNTTRGYKSYIYYNETIQRYVDSKISAITESVSGRSQSFAYDNMGRLLTSIDNGTATKYTYDDYHNIVIKGGTTNSYNQSGTRLTNAYYDLNGNTTKDTSGNTYAYDASNRMQQAVLGGITTNYGYDSDDLITSRSNASGTNATLYVWDGDQIVMELDDNKSVVTKYIRGNNGELLKAENADGTLKWYYVLDSHGNVVKLIDHNYQVIKSYTYDAFGVEKNIDSNDKNPFRYCGEYYDKYSATIFLRARSYSPSMGRFMEMDSYAGDYNNPLSLNLYTYCEEDPINGIDPSGNKVKLTQWDNLAKGFLAGAKGAYRDNNIGDIINNIKKAKDMVGLIGEIVSGKIPPKDLIALGINTVCGHLKYVINNWHIVSDNQTYSNKEVYEFGRHLAGAYAEIASAIATVVGAVKSVKALKAKFKSGVANGVRESAKGLIGKNFEDYLTRTVGGEGSFSKGGRDFDGGIGNRWWEAKSGQYWDMIMSNPKKLELFKSSMGDRLRIARNNGATYELFSNTSIPQPIKDWLTKKGIPFTEF